VTGSGSYPGRVGFIGLGQMGLPMAGHLAAGGVDLAVFDTDLSRTGRVAGASPATSAAEAVAGARAVIFMLPDGTVLDRLLFGEEALAQALEPGAVVIDMGSSDPYLTRRIAARCTEAAHPFIDAPVSGGVRKAVSGELAIMAGGETQEIDRVLPLFELMGARVFRLGPAGSGQAVKALNNLVSAAGLLAAAEALRIGEAFGLKPAGMVEVWNASTGKNNATENKLEPFIISGRYDSGFAMKLMVKDLRAAMGIAEAEAVAAPGSRHVAGTWAQALSDLEESADHTEIHRWLTRLKDAGEA